MQGELRGRPYPNEIVCNERMRYVEWNTDELREAMREDKFIESAVYGLLYTELVEGLRRQKSDPESVPQTQEQAPADHAYVYKLMMQAVLADGLIHPLEKAMLSDFAEKYNISQEHHAAVLHELGWTEEEYKKGLGEAVKLLR